MKEETSFGKVLIIDDLLATGGTAVAVVELVNKLKGVIVETAFCIELSFLEARKIKGLKNVFSIIEFE